MFTSVDVETDTIDDFESTPESQHARTWFAKQSREKLLQGECFLQYKKMDGTLRTTTGTLCSDLIPEDRRSRADANVPSTRNISSGLISYYDTASQGWRSFFPERLRRIFLIP
jgi:hypothetical protein